MRIHHARYWPKTVVGGAVRFVVNARYDRYRAVLPWALGALLGLAVVGPGLAPGSLLNLDLVLIGRLPVPHGVWGLGPELPQRMPIGVPLAWLAWLTGGPFVGKTLIVASVAIAFVGASRMARGAPLVCRLGAGGLYALSPFMLTRVGVGHINVLAAAAVLPWAVTSLLRPTYRLERTLLAAAALGFTGSVGGTFAFVAVVVGLITERGRRLPAVASVLVVSQLPWLVPASIAAIDGTRLADASRFPTDLHDPLGLLRLVAGYGFWRSQSQVGGIGGLAVVVLAAVIVVLVIRGVPTVVARYGWAPIVLGALGLTSAAASGIIGLRSVYATFSRTPLGAPMREGQRYLPLFLVWMAPAAAFGAADIGRRVRANLASATEMLPIVVAFLLAAPGLWGVGGALQPIHVPSDWAAVRQTVDRAPGTVLALPWHEYLDISFAGGRRVLNPVRTYLDQDVISSSDPELGKPHRESLDPREDAVPALLARIASGQRAGPQLLTLGVKWVVVLHEADWQSIGALRNAPDLHPVVHGNNIDLLAVDGWQGSIVDTRGVSVSTSPVVAPLRRVAPSGVATWATPGAPGWLRGSHAARQSPLGLVQLPAGRGPVWYWPALLTVAGDAVFGLALVLAWRRRQGPFDTPETDRVVLPRTVL